MKLSAFSDVCLRVMMVTGAHAHTADDPALVTTQELARTIEVPYNHVAKAVLQLGKLGALEVIRGRNGGIRISQSGLGTSVGALLRALDQRTDVVDCQTENHTCPLASDCRLRAALRRAREAFYATLDPITIHDLVRDSAVPLLPMPHIPAPVDD